MSILASPQRRLGTETSRAAMLRICSLLLILLIGLWTASQAPRAVAGTTTDGISQAAHSRTHFEVPDSADARLKLKAVIVCEWTEAKPQPWRPGPCLISGDFSAYAGTRGSARIPADRIRQTAVPLGHGFFHRGPPLSA